MNRVIAVYPRLAPRACLQKYTYSPARGWKWLQRLCFRLLDKIGAHDIEMVTIKHVSLDSDRLSVALLQKHSHEVQRLMYEPGRMLIGAEDWAVLMGDPVLDSVVRFNAPVDIRSNYFRICGIDVTIIPWMRGLVVIPKRFL